jgi:hypothetical protein
MIKKPGGVKGSQEIKLSGTFGCQDTDVNKPRKNHRLTNPDNIATNEVEKSTVTAAITRGK